MHAETALQLTKNVSVDESSHSTLPVAATPRGLREQRRGTRGGLMHGGRLVGIVLAHKSDAEENMSKMRLIHVRCCLIHHTGDIRSYCTVCLRARPLPVVLNCLSDSLSDKGLKIARLKSRNLLLAPLCMQIRSPHYLQVCGVRRPTSACTLRRQTFPPSATHRLDVTEPTVVQLGRPGQLSTEPAPPAPRWGTARPQRPQRQRAAGRPPSRRRPRT